MSFILENGHDLFRPAINGLLIPSLTYSTTSVCLSRPALLSPLPNY